MSKQTKKSKGPEPDTLKIENDWNTAINKAIKKERPEGGWPEPEKKEKPKSE